MNKMYLYMRLYKLSSIVKLILHLVYHYWFIARYIGVHFFLASIEMKVHSIEAVYYTSLKPQNIDRFRDYLQFLSWKLIEVSRDRKVACVRSNGDNDTQW